MIVSYTHQKDFEDWLKKKIRCFNNDISKHHRAYRKPGSIKNINIIEYSDGILIAGLHAQIYWICMKIENLFVDAPFRRSGIGSKLLERAIEIARSNHCSYIFLETYSFQAVEFYKRFGFYVIGEISDHPPGESFYTMRLDVFEDK